MVIDAETERTIKEPGVRFELYGNNHALQILNVYYPERLTFRDYETTENGTFYLPEKLSNGNYELHELSEPEGYDALETVPFLLDEMYDWQDPLVVRVPLYPARNIIRVQMLDARTSQGIPGGIFDVIADENIITADGTLRYRSGEIVGQIICGEDGRGESGELYLGSYRLRQAVIPDYYLGLEEELHVEVEKKSMSPVETTVLNCERTTIAVSLADELYTDRAISGAGFALTPAGSTRSIPLTTDAGGRILFDQLEKNTSYTISQTAAVGDYRPTLQTESFAVDALGRIDGQAQASYLFYNHVIRVSIGVEEEFTKLQMSNVNLALFHAADNTMIRSWTTTGVPVTFTSLDAGDYYVILSGDRERRFDINVYDQADLQEITLHTTHYMHTVILAGVILLAVILLVVLIVVFRQGRKRKKRKKQDENPDE